MSRDNFTIPKLWKGFTGYVADASIAPPEALAPPSINCMVNENGEAEQRLGYLDASITLNQDGLPATSWYCQKYDLTFFAIGTKVLYYDWTTQATVDTGLTLTTGTVTRFAEFEGDIYLTNTTDGLRRIVVGRLNGATAAGGNITVDRDMAARLSVFGLATGSVLIGGTSETYSAVTISSGVLTATSTANYADNAIVIRTHDISSGREKASKIIFWKRRMSLLGSEVADNADQPNSTLFYGKFASPLQLEDIIDFTYGAGGSTREQVGNVGRLTNAVPVKNFLYQFTESEGYLTADSDVVTSGTAIGQTTPVLKDENNGCLNEDCAASTGNNEVSYITATNRILRIRLSNNYGAAVEFPDEQFDVPVRTHVRSMDSDQTGALVFHWKGGRQTIYQVKVSGQWLWLVYDHRINAWQPPQQIVAVSSFFERRGVLYGCDASDDTVYSFFTSFADNGGAITCTLATGNFYLGDGMIKTIATSGLVSQAADIRLKCQVANVRGGNQTGSEKHVLGSSYTYSDDFSVGAVPVGSGGVVAETTLVAAWKKAFDQYPSEANRVQLLVNQSAEGGYFRLSRFTISGTNTPTPLSS